MKQTWPIRLNKILKFTILNTIRIQQTAVFAIDKHLKINIRETVRPAHSFNLFYDINVIERGYSQYSLFAALIVATITKTTSKTNKSARNGIPINKKQRGIRMIV